MPSIDNYGMDAYRLDGLPPSSQSLLDWSAYNPVYNFTGNGIGVTAGNDATFVSVTGRGVFKWCRGWANGAPFYPPIRIIIDGTPYVFNQTSLDSGQYLVVGNEAKFDIPFNESLIIQVINATGSTVTLYCDYLYLLEKSTPTNQVTLLTQSQRLMAHMGAQPATMTPVVSVAGSGYLLEARFEMGVSGVSPGPALAANIAIDNSVKMGGRTLLQFGAAVKHSNFWGPIRFNSNLLISAQLFAGTANGVAVCRVWYTLD
jgi:hypothetical protein